MALALLPLSLLPAAETEKNLISLASFEHVSFQQTWEIITWQKTSTVEITGEMVHTGNYALKISSGNSNNMVMITQYCQVEGGRYYKFSGWIATQGVTLPGVGGNLKLIDHDFSVGNLKGNQEWTYLKLFFKTSPGQTSIRIGAGLGENGRPALGSVYVDDLSLEPLNSRPEDFREITENKTETQQMTTEKQQSINEDQQKTTTHFQIPASTVFNLLGLLLIALFIFFFNILNVKFRLKHDLKPEDVLPFCLKKILQRIKRSNKNENSD